MSRRPLTATPISFAFLLLFGMTVPLRVDAQTQWDSARYYEIKDRAEASRVRAFYEQDEAVRLSLLTESRQDTVEALTILRSAILAGQLDEQGDLPKDELAELHVALVRIHIELGSCAEATAQLGSAYEDAPLMHASIVEDLGTLRTEVDSCNGSPPPSVPYNTAQTAPASTQAAQSTPQTPTVQRTRQRRPIGLMIAGWSTFVGSWAFTGLVGLELMTFDEDPYTECINCDDVGPLLLIPIAGPFLGVKEADGTDGKAILVVLGLVQVTGLVLAIAGTAKFVRSGNTNTARIDDGMPTVGFYVLPGPNPQGAATLQFRF